MIILMMVILKLLFMLELWLGVIDKNKVSNARKIQAKY